MGAGGIGDLIFPEATGGGARPRGLDLTFSGGGARLSGLIFSDNHADESIPAPLAGLFFTVIRIVSPS